jgi:hypothetical protein
LQDDDLLALLVAYPMVLALHCHVVVLLEQFLVVLA